MNLKKILCAVLALALMLGGAALAEDADARIAELEAQVAELTAALEEAQAAIKAYEEQSYVVTFDGGVVTLEDAQAQYSYIVSMYEAYGYSISGYEDYLREEILHMLARDAVVNAKAAELGFDQLDAEALASYEAEAQATYESSITAYMSYFAEEGADEAETRAAAEDYLRSEGYAYEDVLASLIASHAQEALYSQVTAGVEITEEDVQAAYDAAVSTDEGLYSASLSDYESARTNGVTVYWNPEGYRRVKHILVRFDDEQRTRYDELSGLADDLEARIAAAAEDGDAADAEGDEADAEGEPVDVDELELQLAETMTELDALYQELMPRAEEVIARFEAGEDFEALLAEFGEDPGMQQEPGLSQGYFVSADSQIWEQAFTDGAMRIAGAGEISEPVYGSNGIHIIYYLADVPAGAVDLESVRTELEADTLADKLSGVYDAQVDAWMEEMHVEYHLDRFK